MKKRKKKALPSPKFSVVRDFRVRLGRSQAEVARFCKIRANDMTRLERGNNIRLSTCKAVADYLGISVDAVVRNDIRAAAAFIQGPPTVIRTLQAQICEVNDDHNIVGNAGEDWVYQLERQKLAGTEFENLINPNFANDPDSHFDIQSYDPDTFEPKLIEVKSSKGHEENEFYLSDGEYRLLLECARMDIPYELHRVAYALTPRKRSETVYSPKEFLKNFDVFPIKYAVRRKEQKHNDRA